MLFILYPVSFHGLISYGRQDIEELNLAKYVDLCRPEILEFKIFSVNRRLFRGESPQKNIKEIERALGCVFHHKDSHGYQSAYFRVDEERFWEVPRDEWEKIHEDMFLRLYEDE